MNAFLIAHDSFCLFVYFNKTVKVKKHLRWIFIVRLTSIFVLILFFSCCLLLFKHFLFRLTLPVPISDKEIKLNNIFNFSFLIVPMKDARITMLERQKDA